MVGGWWLVVGGWWFVAIYNQPPTTNHQPPLSWFDQTVIPILAFINYADAISLRVPEDQEIFGRLDDLHHRLFSGHRFDRVTPRTDDAGVVSLGFDRGQWAWRDLARRRGTMFAGDDFPLDLERLASQTVHCL